MDSRTSRAFATAAILPALIAGCGGGGASTTVSSGVRSYDSLQFALTVPKAVYGHGEPIPLTFSVTNTGRSTLNLERGPCDWSDTKVSGAANVIWQKSVGHGCAAQVIGESIAPGETKTYSYSWPQTDQAGNPVSAGAYTLMSWYQVTSPTDPKLSPGTQGLDEFAFPIQVTVQ